MNYNLTDRQKDLVRWLVDAVRAGQLSEEFTVVWSQGGSTVLEFHGDGSPPEFTEGALDALSHADLLHCRPHTKVSSSGRLFEASRGCTLAGTAYTAVDRDFDTPDTSFIRYLTPLADVPGFDSEIQQRCLPTLGTGGANPANWDTALRNCRAILEERLRDVGGISDASRVGRDLVNAVFGKSGALTPKFANDAEREGYRDLYAGIVGAFTNPSGHRFIDPTPEDGGAVLLFVNLLLAKLESLR